MTEAIGSMSVRIEPQQLTQQLVKAQRHDGVLVVLRGAALPCRPHVLGLQRCGRRLTGMVAAPSRRRAQLVEVTPLAALSAHLYRAAIALLTACRQNVVSPGRGR